MKIVFITREGYRLPGARIRCFNFARELNKHGIATRVISCADHLGALDGENEARMKWKDKIRIDWALKKELDKEKDAVWWFQRFHYHSLTAFAGHKGRPLVLDLDDWEMRENPVYHWGFFPSSKAHYGIRLLAGKSAFCVAASRFLSDFLTPFQRRIIYAPSAVDTSLFTPSPAEEKKEGVTLAWIGTLHRPEYVANIALALGSFKALRRRHDHLRLEIRADGIYRDQVDRMIASQHDPHVRRLGWILPDEMPAYLRGIDIGLFPVAEDNKFNKAKSPTKLFEYMAMEKPTVSTAIGEAACIIRDAETGFLAKDAGAFTERLGALIEDAGLRREMGRRARQEILKNFSLEAIGGRLAGAIREHLKEF